MNIATIESPKDYGFVGFKKISDLILDTSIIPKGMGVYLVLRPENSIVNFIENGTGGFFKGRDPNVAMGELKKNWIEEAQIIYIGKAGGTGSKATLNSRLNQYLQFGQGKNIGHRGGRYIWQIDNISDYVICWKELSDKEPRSIEKELIELFRQKYNKRPFANLTN